MRDDQTKGTFSIQVGVQGAVTRCLYVTSWVENGLDTLLCVQVHAHFRNDLLKFSTPKTSWRKWSFLTYCCLKVSPFIKKLHIFLRFLYFFVQMFLQDFCRNSQNERSCVALPFLATFNATELWVHVEVSPFSDVYLIWSMIPLIWNHTVCCSLMIRPNMQSYADLEFTHSLRGFPQVHC